MSAIKGILLVHALAVLIVLVSCRQFHEVTWNSKYYPSELITKPLEVRIDDQLTITCPAFDDDSMYQYAKIYMVSRMEWQYCMVMQPTWVGICNDNKRNTTIKIVFREMTPTPNGFEFKPFNDYYIISTSSGTHKGLNQTLSGLCMDHGLRLKISVLEKKIEPTQIYIPKTEKWDARDNKMMFQIHEIGELTSSSCESSLILVFVLLIIRGY